MILATLTAILYGSTIHAALFMLAAMGAGAVLVIDIDTPLKLAF
jgi:hypothetical protein